MNSSPSTDLPRQDEDKITSRGRSSSVVKRSIKRLHEQVVAQWLISDVRELTYENAWFFFEVIVSKRSS